MSDFSGKTVLITGGSSGIGLSLGKLFAQEEANVWILARRADMNKKAINELQQISISPGQVIRRIVADVTNYHHIQKAINFLKDRNQFPDIVINSAGVCHPGIFEELEINIFHWMMNVNYFGTVNVCKNVIPGMIQRGSGHIVNISSLAGFLGVYGYSAYTPSKYAVRGFSETLRAEMKLHGIRVSLVVPPDTETPQLVYEEQYKPEVTKDLTGTAGRLSPDTVARTIVTGIINGKYLITPGLESAILVRLSGMLGNLVYPIMDWMVARAMKKIQKQGIMRGTSSDLFQLLILLTLLLK